MEQNCEEYVFIPVASRKNLYEGGIRCLTKKLYESKSVLGMILARL